MKTAERKSGGVFYSGPVTHSVENTGSTPIHNLIVELKGVEAAGARPFEGTPVAVETPPAGSDS